MNALHARQRDALPSWLVARCIESVARRSLGGRLRRGAAVDRRFVGWPSLLQWISSVNRIDAGDRRCYGPARCNLTKGSKTTGRGTSRLEQVGNERGLQRPRCSEDGLSKAPFGFSKHQRRGRPPEPRGLEQPSTRLRQRPRRPRPPHSSHFFGILQPAGASLVPHVGAQPPPPPPLAPPASFFASLLYDAER